MPFAIFSTDSSADRPLVLIAAAALLLATTAPVAFAQAEPAPSGPAPAAAPAAPEASRVAVFPPLDRTGRSAPVDHLQEALELSLASRGFVTAAHADLEGFFERHRVRYVGGITSDVARAIGEELRVDGVLMTSVDDWERVDPPRFALTCRSVSATADATVSWMETSAHHGQEAPGAFGLGLVFSPEVLIQRVSNEIADSVAARGLPS